LRGLDVTILKAAQQSLLHERDVTTVRTFLVCGRGRDVIILKALRC